MSDTNPRSSWYVPALDPDSTYYMCTDSTLIDDDVEPRERDDSDRANAFASLAADGSDRHYPCFDVDKELIFGQRLVLDLMFPNHLKVESSTPGHFHLYHPDPLTWTEYADKLRTLVECGIVEEGYVDAALMRKATFVRMPHVKKRSVVGGE